jgi:hypothetical protein
MITWLWKAFNFYLDLVQTWQFGGSGLLGAIVAFIVWYKELTTLNVLLFSLTIGLLIIPLVSLVFQSYSMSIMSKNELNRLPNLAYKIHKRTDAVRDNLVRATDWAKVDKAKVLGPMTEVALRQGKPKSKTKGKIIDFLRDSIGSLGGVTAMKSFDTWMKDSDTSLVKWLKTDFKYQVLMARLEGYKPFPDQAISEQVYKIIDGSITYNNLIIFQNYYTYIPVHVEAMEVHLAVQNFDKDLLDTIDLACANLRTQVERYLTNASTHSSVK